MSRCLAVLVLLPFFAAAPGHAQVRGLPVSNGAHARRPSDLDVTLLEHPEFKAATPSLADGMITRREVSTNAFVGMGLVDMNGRARDGSDMRADVPRVISTNPAVAFVVKF